MYMNNRINARERGLIKGALRRVFSRSDIRRQAIEQSVIQHIDESRPRVKKWSMCPECGKPTPTYLLQVDHIIPLIPLDKNLEDMTWDELMDRLWCDISNLKAICLPCHKEKTRQERKLRLQYKKEKKKNE